jgi:hypothetical protein
MRASSGRSQVRAAVCWAAIWVTTRLLLVWVVIDRPGIQQDVRGDMRLYDTWSAALLHGSTAPFGDARWQYPPGAALVMAAPRLLPFSYVTNFMLLALLTDALVTLLLWRHWLTRDRSADSSATVSPGGAAYWIVGVALLGPVAITRFDIVPAAAAVAALLTPTVISGLLIGAGAGIKLWPGLLAVLPDRPWGIHRPLARTIAVAVGALVVTVPVLALDAGLATEMFRHQAARGLQVESIAASPFVLVHMFGFRTAAGYSYGAFQMTGTVASTLALVAIIVGLAAVLYVAWDAWQPAAARFLGRLTSGRKLPRNLQPQTESGRSCPPLASTATAILLCLLVAYRVLSPQYLLWPLATISVAIARGEIGSRRTGGLLLVAALLTQIVYPWRYNDLLQGRPGAGVVLLSRNAVLVAAAVSAMLAVRAAGRCALSSASPPDSGRGPVSATSSPSATVSTSAMPAPPETSSDSGRRVGNVASTRNADPAAIERRDNSPATARTAKADAKYQG